MWRWPRRQHAKNLAMLKSWLGDGAWKRNRWGARGGAPAIPKELLDEVKAKLLNRCRRRFT